MPKKYEMIVVGAGTSALTYLYAALQAEGPKTYSIAEAKKGFGDRGVPESVMAKLRGDFPDSVLVVGDSDLWNKAQSFNTGYKVGQTSDHVRTPTSTVPIGQNSGFRPVTEYTAELKNLQSAVAAGLKKIDKGIDFIRDQVVKITQDGCEYRVKTLSNALPFTCKKVVLASGAGPTSLPDPVKTENIKNNHLLKHKRDYEEIIGGTEYIYSLAPRGKNVLVYGGAPTSAWVVARAKQHACRILWVSRSGWGTANPAGRNKEVIEWAKKNNVMLQFDIKEVEITTPAVIGLPRIQVTLTNGMSYLVDQLIYATGADPLGKGGPGQIIDSTLREKLIARFDPNYRFSPTDNVPVAWANDEETFWVVGAPVFRGLGKLGGAGTEALKKFQEKYRKISNIMGEAGTPEEGVAVVTASIKSVTGYTQAGGNFNWNTADLLELRAFLVRAYGNILNDAERADLAVKIVDERSRKGAFPVQFPREAFVDIIQNYKNLKLPDPFSEAIKTAHEHFTSKADPGTPFGTTLRAG